MYENGAGCELDLAKAVTLYRQGAMGKNADAQSNLRRAALLGYPGAREAIVEQYMPAINTGTRR